MVLGNTASSCLCFGYDPQLDKELMDEATALPVCDYDENPTRLYKAMEQHQWGAVSRFLKTGVWPGDYFSDKQTPREQVRTWVHRYDDDFHELRDDVYGDQSTYHAMVHMAMKNDAIQSGHHRAAAAGGGGGKGKRRLRWRQLPLHAALIFMAPPVLVKQLIEAFPYALRCPDDKGMLPLHLAFRQAVPDDVLTMLLRLFPNGMHVRDLKGRLPVECVRMDLMDETSAQQPVRGMIIQSIMQQSKDKFSKQQQDTIQSFQKDIEALQTKMKSLEQDLKLMDQREKNTQQELSATLEQLQALKKSHRKLQEIQRYAIERQSQQDAMDKQTHSFQQRIIEQLDMNTPRREGRGRSLSRGRSKERDHERFFTDISPRERPPSTPPSVRRQGSRAASAYTPSRRPSQSSLSQNLLEDDDTPSFSSGISSVQNAYTTTTAFTGKSNVFGTRSYATKATVDDGMETDIDDQTATMPLHHYQSVLNNRRRDRRPIAKAIYPVKTASDSLMGGNVNDKSHHGKDGAVKNDSSNEEAAKSPSLNWGFSFTPGFLQPLSVKNL